MYTTDNKLYIQREGREMVKREIIFRMGLVIAVFLLSTSMSAPQHLDLQSSKTFGSQVMQEPEGDGVSLVPPVPENVQSTDGWYWNKIQTTWDEASTATYYEVYRSTGTSMGPYDDFLGTTTDLYWDYPIIENTVQWFGVWACNEHGCSDGGAYDPSGGYAEAGFDTVGYYHPVQKKFYLKLAPTDGWQHFIQINFGGVGDDWIPVAGDWDGDGKDNVGLYNKVQRRWYLKNSHAHGWVDFFSVNFGGVSLDWIPVTGDWNGDGTDTVGFFVPDQDKWYLKNTHADGWVDYIVVGFGGDDADWQPVTGDWDLDNQDEVGFYVPSQRRWYLKNTMAKGWVDLTVVNFGGAASDLIALAGNWGNT